MLNKRLFDITFAFIGLLFLGWFILFISLIAFFDCGGRGLFIQKRIGQYGKPFNIFKIRTLHFQTRNISTFGEFLRNYKLDELPQLVNILLGKMSFVGPRPDVAGYYDRLEGDARKLLELKPGLCSIAALKYYNEETLLAQQQNPMNYNDNVIFPDKIAMNLKYYHSRSMREDLLVLSACTRRMICKIFKKQVSEF